MFATYFFITKTNVVPLNTDDTLVAIDTTATTSIKEKTSVPASTIAYADALKKYADRRIQISPTCQVVPNNITYKNGTTIMIDNRSNKTKTIKIGSVFTIPAYGFKIITLSSGSLPATYFIDCDKQQNSGTITLQK